MVLFEVLAAEEVTHLAAVAGPFVVLGDDYAGC